VTNTTKQCVVVLGMHRSGTSTIAGSLATLGVSFGKNLLPADLNNPRGYFENNRIVETQNQLLLEAGYSWLNPISENVDKSCFSTLNILNQFEKILEDEFSGNNLYGFKDPRTSCFLEAWLEVFRTLDIEPLFVICIRKPISVIKSLQRRDGLEFLHAELLWLLEYIRVLPKIIKYKHILVNYDDFIYSPGAIIKKIHRNLQININCEDNDLLKVESFVDKDLNHSIATEDLRDCTNNIWLVMESISKSSSGEITLDEYESITEIFADVSNYNDWNLMQSFPNTVKSWNAKLYYQNYFSSEHKTKYITNKVSWSPNRWINIRFILGEEKSYHLILELLEYMGEYAISNIQLYDDIKSKDSFIEYQADQLKEVFEFWGHGEALIKDGCLNVIHFDRGCQLKLNLSSDEFEKVKILDMRVCFKALYYSDSLKELYQKKIELNTIIEPLINSRLYRWYEWLRRIKKYISYN